MFGNTLTIIKVPTNLTWPVRNSNTVSKSCVNPTLLWKLSAYCHDNTRWDDYSNSFLQVLMNPISKLSVGRQSLQPIISGVIHLIVSKQKSCAGLLVSGSVIVSPRTSTIETTQS